MTILVKININSNSKSIFQNVKEGLELAAQAFLEGDDGIKIDMDKKVVKLSKIFDWYRVDFGRTDEEVGIFPFIPI